MVSNMIQKSLVGFTMTVVLAVGAASAFAGDCETRLKTHGLLVLNSEIASICNQRPKEAVLTCFLSVTTRSKNNLRQRDYVDVYSACAADSSQWMQECLVLNFSKIVLAQASKDVKYVGPRKIGDQCILLKHKENQKTKKGNSK